MCCAADLSQPLCVKVSVCRGYSLKEGGRVLLTGDDRGLVALKFLLPLNLGNMRGVTSLGSYLANKQHEHMEPGNNQD